MNPETQFGTKVLRDAQAYEALKKDLEKDAAKLAMFDELVDRLNWAASILTEEGYLRCAKICDNLVKKARKLS